MTPPRWTESPTFRRLIRSRFILYPSVLSLVWLSIDNRCGNKEVIFILGENMSDGRRIETVKEEESTYS